MEHTKKRYKAPSRSTLMVLGLVLFIALAFIIVKATAQCTPDDFICINTP